MNTKVMEYVQEMNRLGEQRIPFLFIIDFEKRKPVVLPLSAVHPENILYDFQGNTNVRQAPPALPELIQFHASPVSFERYQQAYTLVREHLLAGNSFLVNLTFPTVIQTNLSLKQIFFHSKALYKLWFADAFVVFSPETFISIQGGELASYPMKGTIDSAVPHAEERLLNDSKEIAEHVTIVDLIRNDMSQVASQVRVEKFRYLDRIVTHEGKELLQASSKITGRLGADYHSQLGNILEMMLPAGSVSGAPKPKTLSIIRAAEQGPRGYYTGVAGIFDGENMDACVLIRYIEQQQQQLFFRSGGGITALSKLEQEYQELIDKVYVPIH